MSNNDLDCSQNVGYGRGQSYNIYVYNIGPTLRFRRMLCLCFTNREMAYPKSVWSLSCAESPEPLLTENCGCIPPHEVVKVAWDLSPHTFAFLSFRVRVGWRKYLQVCPGRDMHFLSRWGHLEKWAPVCSWLMLNPCLGPCWQQSRLSPSVPQCAIRPLVPHHTRVPFLEGGRGGFTMLWDGLCYC